MTFYPSKRLLDMLGLVTKKPNQHIFYNYILAYDEFLGSSQDILIDMANRLGFSISIERYKDVNDNRNEGITLREIIYYEYWYYLKYVEPNLKKKNLPPTEVMINMSFEEYKKIFKTLYPEVDYNKDKYNTRLSLITDYFTLLKPIT